MKNLPIRETIDRAIEEKRLVGANVIVLRDGHVWHRQASGFADRNSGRLMKEDTLFRYSSLTKPIVTAAAMVLVEQGRLDLQAPVHRYLPEFRPRTADDAEPTITVHQVLTHTAGLTYRFHDLHGPYAAAGVSDGLDRLEITMAENLRRISSVPLSYQPGEDWGYSVAIDILGEIVARTSDLSLPMAVAQLVCRPLGLADTGFSVRDASRLATPYLDGQPPRIMADPELVSAADGTGVVFSPTRAFDEKCFPSGGAGMIGSTDDFAKFLEILRTGGQPILQPATVATMMSNQIGSLRIDMEPTPAWGFGYGGAVLIDPILARSPQATGTWSWGGIYGHKWFVDRENRLTVAALTNTTFEGFAGSFVQELRDAVYCSL